MSLRWQVLMIKAYTGHGVAFAGKLSVNQKRHDIDRRWFTGVLLMVKTKMEINNTNAMTKPKTTWKMSSEIQ